MKKIVWKIMFLGLVLGVIAAFGLGSLKESPSPKNMRAIHDKVAMTGLSEEDTGVAVQWVGDIMDSIGRALDLATTTLAETVAAAWGTCEDMRAYLAFNPSPIDMVGDDKFSQCPYPAEEKPYNLFSSESICAQLPKSQQSACDFALQKGGTETSDPVIKFAPR